MPSQNIVLIVGIVANDPELRTVNGKSICRLYVETHEAWTDADGQRHTFIESHPVVVWGAQAEACAKRLMRGSEVYINGATRTRKYVKDGVNREVREVIAQFVKFLGPTRPESERVQL